MSRSHQLRKFQGRAMEGVCLLAAILAVIPLFAFLWHLVAMGAWAAFNVHMDAHVMPWLGWCIVGGILLREQWVVRGGRLDRIDHAFFTLNSLVGLIFFTGFAAEWFIARALP